MSIEESEKREVFQFGCQVFEVGVVVESAEGVVVTTLRDRSPLRTNHHGRGE